MFVMFINTVLGLHLLVAIEINITKSKYVYNIETTRIFSWWHFAHNRCCHSPTINERLNGFAMFDCTAIASLITWEIDGVLIDSDYPAVLH